MVKDLTGSDLSAEIAHQICSKLLGKEWAEVSPGKIFVEKIHGGTSSRVYCVTNKSSGQQIICRIFGGNIANDNSQFKALDQITEDLLYYRLGNLELGPKLLAVFNGGRIEEYIPSRTLSNSDLFDRRIRLQIARKLARIHSICNFPIRKDPIDVLVAIQSLIQNFEKLEGQTELVRIGSEKHELKSMINTILSFNWNEALKWLTDRERLLPDRTTLTIWDLNRCNCLVRPESAPDRYGEWITLIDYEFAGYNQRGFDLGGHFTHWTLDMRADNFLSGLSYPSREIRLEFCHEYLRQLQLEHGDGLDRGSAKELLMEAEFWAMANAIFVAQLFVQPDQKFMTCDKARAFVTMTVQMLRIFEDRKSELLRNYPQFKDSD